MAALKASHIPLVAITKLVMNIADSRVNTMAGLYDLMEGHSSTTHAPRVSKRPITVEATVRVICKIFLTFKA